MSELKFHTVLLMTCPKAAFTESMDEVEGAKKALAEIGVNLVVIRYNNNTTCPPRMESFRIENISLPSVLTNAISGQVPDRGVNAG